MTPVAGEAVAGRPYAHGEDAPGAEWVGGEELQRELQPGEQPDADDHASAASGNGRLVVFNAIPPAAPMMNNPPAPTVSARMARPV